MKKITFLLSLFFSTLTFAVECNLPGKQLFENSPLINKFMLLSVESYGGARLDKTPAEFYKLVKDTSAGLKNTLNKSNETDQAINDCYKWVLSLDYDSIGQNTDDEFIANSSINSVKHQTKLSIERLEKLTLPFIEKRHAELVRIDKEIYHERGENEEWIGDRLRYEISFKVYQKTQVTCSFYDHNARLLGVQDGYFDRTSETIGFIAPAGAEISRHYCELLKSL